jgi:SSS family transporter
MEEHQALRVGLDGAGRQRREIPAIDEEDRWRRHPSTEIGENGPGAAGIAPRGPTPAIRFGGGAPTRWGAREGGVRREPELTLLDWAIVILYLPAVLLIGIVAARRAAGPDEFFLAGRSMPAWAVAISLLATMQSVATFIGGPEQAFRGDLTYLAATLALLLAAVVVAAIFLPAFYRQGVTSIYELLERTLGAGAQRGASIMFLVGRVLADGARFFIVALPFSLIAFGDVRPPSMLASIVVLVLVAAAYTMAGGIRAVIYTDVLQAAVYIGAVVGTLIFLGQRLPGGIWDACAALARSPDAGKLTMLDATASWPEVLYRPYSIWAIVLGMTLLNLAALGADQNLCQRLLTCRNHRRAGFSVIAANLIGWPVVALFMLIGLLLYVFYRAPHLVGLAPPAAPIDDTRTVFLTFVLNEAPAGLRGLILAGLFAAAMSSADSALNAMASATIADFYRPWMRRRRGRTPAPREELWLSRLAVAGWAVLLAGFACVCVWWQAGSGQSLIDFALSVMTFAYSGLLALFLAAILTRRGNTISGLCALACGFLVVLLFQGRVWSAVTGWLVIDLGPPPAFPWQMVVATGLSLAVCCCGRRRDRGPG